MNPRPRQPRAEEVPAEKTLKDAVVIVLTAATMLVVGALVLAPFAWLVVLIYRAILS